MQVSFCGRNLRSVVVDYGLMFGIVTGIKDHWGRVSMAALKVNSGQSWRSDHLSLDKNTDRMVRQWASQKSIFIEIKRIFLRKECCFFSKCYNGNLVDWKSRNTITDEVLLKKVMAISPLAVDKLVQSEHRGKCFKGSREKFCSKFAFKHIRPFPMWFLSWRVMLSQYAKNKGQLDKGVQRWSQFICRLHPLRQGLR